MKSASLFALLLLMFSCQSSAPKQENAQATTSVATTTQDTALAQASSINCQREGKLIEKFEQNNAVFERFKNEKLELEWLKITSKDGKCTIVDSIGRANHYSVTFEDWDNDGMKDRIDNWKWDYSVSLFDKSKNDFSRQIDGRFCGEQWDFDKNQNLKYQFLENKYAGSYELYKLVGSTKTVLCQIFFVPDYDDNIQDRIEIRKNIVRVQDEVKFDTVKMDQQLFRDLKPNENDDSNVQLAKAKKAIETYWRKNLSLFLKK